MKGTCCSESFPDLLSPTPCAFPAIDQNLKNVIRFSKAKIAAVVSRFIGVSDKNFGGDTDGNTSFGKEVIFLSSRTWLGRKIESNIKMRKHTIEASTLVPELLSIIH